MQAATAPSAPPVAPAAAVLGDPVGTAVAPPPAAAASDLPHNGMYAAPSAGAPVNGTNGVRPAPAAVVPNQPPFNYSGAPGIVPGIKTEDANHAAPPAALPAKPAAPVARPANGGAAAPPAVSLPPPPASAPGTGSAVSPEDIQTVQNLVERCLQLYMARDEVVSVLKSQATIDPGFTQLVWNKLEEQNPEFFQCYYTRLKLKAQVVMFNHLLEQQVGVVQRLQQGWSGGGGGGAGGAMPTSSTNSGIPLFQGGPNGSGRTPPPGEVDHHHHGGGGGHGGGGKDRLVPGSSGGDLMGSGLDGGGGGGGSLFSPLPHIGSEHDLGNLGNLPTPGELAFLPTTSPLNLASGGVPATLPRNFSLSDLGGLDHDAEPTAHVRRNGGSFGFSEPMI